MSGSQPYPPICQPSCGCRSHWSLTFRTVPRLSRCQRRLEPVRRRRPGSLRQDYAGREPQTVPDCTATNTAFGGTPGRGGPQRGVTRENSCLVRWTSLWQRRPCGCRLEEQRVDEFSLEARLGRVDDPEVAIVRIVAKSVLARWESPKFQLTFPALLAIHEERVVVAPFL